MRIFEFFVTHGFQLHFLCFRPVILVKGFYSSDFNWN